MQPYRAPLKDIRFAMEALGIEEVFELSRFENYDLETVMALLEQGAALSTQELLPLNPVGDTEGLRWDPETGAVTTPKGFRAAYAKLVDSGAIGLTADPKYGGGGAPELVSVGLGEISSACNKSISMCPGLTGGLIEALTLHGSDEQRQAYLPRLISGHWSGTMCLTEPQCGTDLGLIRTRAEPDGDAYRLTGTKIWITFGEHDLTENIVHLVLARLPDAPPGIKGISTFIVPKITMDGQRNGIKCTGLEHKMGIHASPTCVMDLEQAWGYLVGEPHRGMRVMFTMMNMARLNVGVEAIGCSEIAYQTAVGFAKDRRQSRSLDRQKQEKGEKADNILVHPDVRRMLLNQRATNEAMRGLAFWAVKEIDLSHAADDETVRQESEDLAALLTPIVKSYCTERAVQNISDAIQVCGGAGYTRDWSIEQNYRDTRVSMIYEGTNHIQALDLVGRKLPRDGGRLVRVFNERVTAMIRAGKDDEALREFTEPLKSASKALNAVTMRLAAKGMEDPEEAGAVASNYLNLFALTAMAYVWCRMAQHALGQNEAFYATKLRLARYFFSQILPEVDNLATVIRAGKEPMMAFDAEEFDTP